jgi:hypothetical protein
MLRKSLLVCGSMILLIFLLWLSLYKFSYPDKEEITDDTIVAEIDSEKITYADIRVSEPTLLALKKKGWSESQLRHWRKKAEFFSLKRQLEDMIKSEAIEKYGVTLSEEEIDARVGEKLKSHYGKSYFTKDNAREQNKAIESMIRLLETWLTDNERGETLYWEEFSGKITFRHWEHYKREYATREALEELKRRLPVVTVEAVYSIFRKMAIEELNNEKLVDKLRQVGEITEKTDYADWLQKKLLRAKIQRKDIIPVKPREGQLNEISERETIKEIQRRKPNDIDATHLPIQVE